MPLGLNRTSLNVDHKNYRNGNPVDTTTLVFGTPMTLPHTFGNAVTLPITYGNAVTTPHDFGNDINLTNGN